METSGLFSICSKRNYYVMYIRNTKFENLGLNIQNLIKFYGIEYLTKKMDNINIIEEDQVMPYPIEWRSSFRSNYIDNIIEKGYWIQDYGYEDCKIEPQLDDYNNLKYIYILDLDQERFKIKTDFMELEINIDEIGNFFKFKKN